MTRRLLASTTVALALAVPLAYWLGARAAPPLTPALDAIVTPGPLAAVPNFVAEGEKPPQRRYAALEAEMHRRYVVEEAERLRRELAVKHLGGEFDPWPTPCRISLVSYGRGASLAGDPGRGFTITLAGPVEEGVEKHLSFAVVRALLATRAGRPLTPWLDYGLTCYLTADEETRKRLKHQAADLATQGRPFPLYDLFARTGPPQFVNPVTEEYQALAYAVTEFLAGRRTAAEPDPVSLLLRFDAACRTGRGWDGALADCFGYRSLDDLSSHWHLTMGRGR